MALKHTLLLHDVCHGRACIDALLIQYCKVHELKAKIWHYNITKLVERQRFYFRHPHDLIFWAPRHQQAVMFIIAGRLKLQN